MSGTLGGAYAVLKRFNSDGEPIDGIIISSSTDPLDHGAGSLPSRNDAPIGKISGFFPGTGRTMTTDQVSKFDWEAIENEAKKH